MARLIFFIISLKAVLLRLSWSHDYKLTLYMFKQVAFFLLSRDKILNMTGLQYAQFPWNTPSDWHFYSASPLIPNLFSWTTTCFLLVETVRAVQEGFSSTAQKSTSIIKRRLYPILRRSVICSRARLGHLLQFWTITK